VVAVVAQEMALRVLHLAVAAQAQILAMQRQEQQI
jgi:hypothetical protein